MAARQCSVARVWLLYWGCNGSHKYEERISVRNYLELNVNKTTEVILDFRRNPTNIDPLLINGSEVETVNHFKFFGIQISAKLKWEIYVDQIVSRAQQILYFLRPDCEQGSADTLLPSTSQVVWCQSGADGKVL